MAHWVPCAARKLGGGRRPLPPCLRGLCLPVSRGCQPGAPAPTCRQNFQTGWPTEARGGPIAHLLTHLPRLSCGPQCLQGLQEQERVLAWGDKTGLCRAHQPRLDQCLGAPHRCHRVSMDSCALSGQSSRYPFPGTCGLAICSAHWDGLCPKLGGSPGLMFQ